MAWVDNASSPTMQALDAAIVQAVGNFCSWCTNKTFPVVRGWTNAVSRPISSYIVITPLSAKYHRTNLRTYTPDANDMLTGSVSIERGTSRIVQIDCCGQGAQTAATTISTLAVDLFGCDYFKGYDLTPLTVTDPREMTGPVGNKQAESRWMIELEMQAGQQFTAVVINNIDFFNTITLRDMPQG